MRVALQIPNDARQVAVCLAGVAASLILVGVVSDTLARHVVQVVPVVLAAGLILWRPATGAWFAIPLFVVWGAVMLAIWAYLTGLANITEGSFSFVEIVLTIVIAACSAWGIRKGLHAGRALPLIARVTAGLCGFGLQAAFLAVSLQYLGSISLG